MANSMEEEGFGFHQSGLGRKMFGVTCTPHPDALFVDHAKWPHSLKQYLDEYVSLMWCFNVFQGCCVPGLNDLYAILYQTIPYILYVQYFTTLYRIPVNLN